MSKFVYDRKKQSDILAIISVGCSQRIAAEYVGCSEKAIRETAIRDPEFAEELCHAEHRAELSLIKRIHKAAMDEKNWRAAAWALERLNPEDFGPRRPDTITRKQFVQVLMRITKIIVEEIPDEALRERVFQRIDVLVNELEES